MNFTSSESLPRMILGSAKHLFPEFLLNYNLYCLGSFTNFLNACVKFLPGFTGSTWRAGIKLSIAQWDSLVHERDKRHGHRKPKILVLLLPISGNLEEILRKFLDFLLQIQGPT